MGWVLRRCSGQATATTLRRSLVVSMVELLRADSEQLTYLLFLKMADERTKPPYNQPSAVPAKYNWPTLLKKDGDDLFDHYRHMLESLGNHCPHYC